MRSVSLRLCDLEKSVIPIGFVGENLHTLVKIDCKKLFEQYPDAIAQMAVVPPRGEVYPAILSRDGDIVIWEVVNSDLIYEGSGEIQLQFTVDDIVAESYVGRIRVLRSVIANGQVPTPWENWLDEFTQLKEDAEAAETGAEQSASDSEAYAVGKRGGVDVDSDDPTYHNNSKYYRDLAASEASGQIQSITDEGTRQIGLVQDEGTTQTGLVGAEGTRQIGLVEAKGEETIASIPSDYTTLSNDVTNLKSQNDDFGIKVTKNLVTSVVSDKVVQVTSSQYIRIDNSTGYRYAKIKVEPGKTYSVNVGASTNFSRWAYNDGTGDKFISNVSFSGNYITTAPDNATFLYLCGNGLPTDLVVLERNTTISGYSITDYPYNTVVRRSIPLLYSDQNGDFIDDILKENTEDINDLEGITTNQWNTISDIGIKYTKNLVTEVVSDKYPAVNSSNNIYYQDGEGYRYVRVKVEEGKTYATSDGASSNYSRFAYEDGDHDHWVSNITLQTGNLITVPIGQGINVAYFSGNGFPSSYVVIESNESITGATVTEYPYNTIVRRKIPLLYSEPNKEYVDDLLTGAKKSAGFHTMSDNIRMLGIEYGTPSVILEPSAVSGAFDDGMIESPMIWWDTNKYKYGMVYTGYKADSTPNTYQYGSIGLAWSDDLITWTKDENAPILERSSGETAPDRGSVTGPVMYIKDGVYYLFYIGCTTAGYEQGTKSLCVATGTDIYNLTKYANNPIIAPTNVDTTPGKLYKYHVYHANIVEWMNKYYMFVNCNGKHPTEQGGRPCENTLCFTSSDLLNWSYYGIALVCSSDEDAPDYQITGDPCIYDIGDEYLYMTFFRASKNYATTSGSIAKCLKSAFPLGWEKTGLVPLSGYAKFFVVQREGKIYIYGSTKRIAMAEGIR